LAEVKTLSLAGSTVKPSSMLLMRIPLPGSPLVHTSSSSLNSTGLTDEDHRVTSEDMHHTVSVAGVVIDEDGRALVIQRRDRDGRDPDVPADANPHKLTGAGQPVDVPWFDAEPFGYLGNGEKPNTGT
jgi:hypothetical protein